MNLRRSFILFLGLAALAMLLALSPLPQLVSAVVVGVLGLAWAIYVTWCAVRSFFKPSRVCRQLCRNLGLATSRRYMVFGRSCSGRVENREVTVRFVPARRPMPPILEIFLQASLPFRIAIARGRPLLDCRECRSWTSVSPLLEALIIRSDGPASPLHFLEDSAVQELLRIILDEEARELYLQPAQIWFRCSPRRLSAQNLERRLAALLALADSAENELHSIATLNRS